MAKVTKQPVMNPEYKYTLELSEDEAQKLVALLCTCSGLDEVYDELTSLFVHRTYFTQIIDGRRCLLRIKQ